MATPSHVRIAIIALVISLAFVAGSGAVWGPTASAGETKLAKDGESAVLIKPDGSLWAWGYNASGQLGVGDTTLRPVAWRVGTGTDWSAVACGEAFGLALKTGGSLWSWGDNTYGQLGLGDTTARTSPTRVGTSSDWLAITCGDHFALALKRDGSLWAWGRNTYGQLGLGNQANRTSPQRVGTGNEWKAVAGGTYFTLALKQDGSLWSWGRNNRGQLGHAGTSSQLTPARVGADSDWATVDCADEDSRATKTDGSLWAWGYNSYGQLGQGNTTTLWAPTVVDDGSTWETVTCGDDHTVALQPDGGLWAWGDNTYGQLGQGDKTSRFLPVRVGTQTSWTAVVCGDDDTAALKADGTLWMWGHNNVGQLAMGDFVDRDSPTYAFDVADAVAPSVSDLESPTHPLATGWYSNNSPAFTWTASDTSGIGGYRYVIDQKATTAAPIAYPKSGASASFSGKSDGVWYFHVRAVDRAGNWGATSTRQVRIDTVAPVTTQTGADDAWHLTPVTVAFKASDARSGVAKTEYRVDDGAFVEGGAVTVSAAGEHVVTYRSTDNAGNVEADKTCLVRIEGAQTTYTITTTAGAHGSVSPSGVQTVDAGDVLTVGIVADAGYHIHDVLVDGASVGAVGSHTFSAVAADHTLTASFAADGVFAVVSPNGGESVPAGVPVTVSWSSQSAAVGTYRVWAVSQSGTSYSIGAYDADGSASWSKTWSAAVATGSYRIRVGYSPVTGGTTYTQTDYSDAFFTVIPAATVLWPNGGESFPAGVPVTVTWSTPPVVGGSYRVWALSQGGTYYNIGTYDADGATSWAKTWNASAAGGSYRIRVSYSPVSGGSTYTWTDYSDAYFTVTPGPVVLSPNGGEKLTAGAAVTVTWSSSAVVVGSYRVWALSQGGTYYNIGVWDADGSTLWGKTWNVAAPAGSYRIRVSYSPVAGSSTYTSTDYSDAYFTVATP